MDEDAEEKRREQNFIVRSGKSEAEVTISKRQRSRRRNAWANSDRQEALRGLSATAELLVSTFVFNPNDCYMMSITTFRDNKVSCCALIFEPCEFGCF